MKMLFALIFALLCLPLQLSGQSCTTAVCNAASPSQTDVIAAWPTAGNTNATVTLNIPAGTSHWTTPQVTLTVPAAVTNFTIQGATTTTCTGTPGSAGYACSATDATVIIDDISTNFGVLQINGSSGTTPLIRVTGITMKNGSGGNKFQGLLLFYSNAAGSQLRIDHNHFNLSAGEPAAQDGMEGSTDASQGSPITTDSMMPAQQIHQERYRGFMNANTCNRSAIGFMAMDRGPSCDKGSVRRTSFLLGKQ